MCCVPVRIFIFFKLIIFKINKIVLKTILDRIHKTVNEKINQSNLIQRQLFHLSYNIKVKRLELGLESRHLDR